VGSYREFWEESFERLEELLEELQAPASETPDQDASATPPQYQPTRGEAT
jgi:hypothetical protein